MSTDTGGAARASKFLEWFWWEPSPRRPCPKSLVGKRHEGPMCVCATYHAVLDHVARWVDRDGHDVLTSEPYGIQHMDRFVAFLKDCDALGIDVSISAQSGYLPGSTILIIMRKKEK